MSTRPTPTADSPRAPRPLLFGASIGAAAAPLSLLTPTGSVERLLVLLWALVELVVVNARLALLARSVRRAAAHDALTGLLNWTGFTDAAQARLDAGLLARPRTQVSALLFDLDSFKGVNDAWGPDVGDALLAAVGARLQAAVRSGDLLAR